MTRPLVAVVIGLAAIVAVGGMALGYMMRGDDGSSGNKNIQRIELGLPSRYTGVRQLPAYEIPPMSLTATDGSKFDLRAKADGKLLMLYVGYTNCPDVCSLQMLEVAEALEQMSPELADQVLAVFITADPERDTPEVLSKWLANFSSDIVGLTGDQATLNVLQQALGLNAASHAANDHGGYDVDHGTMVLAFPPESGKAELVYPVGTTAEQYRSDMEMLVKDKKVRE